MSKEQFEDWLYDVVEESCNDYGCELSEDINEVYELFKSELGTENIGDGVEPYRQTITNSIKDTLISKVDDIIEDTSAAKEIVDSVLDDFDIIIIM